MYSKWTKNIRKWIESNNKENDLIDMIITKKTKKITYTEENDELTKEEANKLLKNNNFAKLSSKENIKPINSLEIKTIKHWYVR